MLLYMYASLADLHTYRYVSYGYGYNLNPGIKIIFFILRKLFRVIVVMKKIKKYFSKIIKWRPVELANFPFKEKNPQTYGINLIKCEGRFRQVPTVPRQVRQVPVCHLLTVSTSLLKYLVRRYLPTIIFKICPSLFCTKVGRGTE